MFGSIGRTSLSRQVGDVYTREQYSRRVLKDMSAGVFGVCGAGFRRYASDAGERNKIGAWHVY